MYIYIYMRSTPKAADVRRIVAHAAWFCLLIWIPARLRLLGNFVANVQTNARSDICRNSEIVGHVERAHIDKRPIKVDVGALRRIISAQRIPTSEGGRRTHASRLTRPICVLALKYFWKCASEQICCDGANMIPQKCVANVGFRQHRLCTNGFCHLSWKINIHNTFFFKQNCQIFC